MLSCLKHNTRSIGFTKTAYCWGYRSAFSNTASDPFADPPSLPLRRVVVTGLGLVTPLGVGVASVWQRLLAGETGVSKLTPDHLPEVAFPSGCHQAQPCCLKSDQVARFSSYAK